MAASKCCMCGEPLRWQRFYFYFCVFGTREEQNICEDCDRQQNDPTEEQILERDYYQREASSEEIREANDRLFDPVAIARQLAEAC